MHNKGRVHRKDKVHGRGPRQGAASPKLKRPPSKQDGGLALLRRDVSHGDVVVADGSLITKVAILGAPLLGAALLTPLYTRMATVALASSRFGASVTLRGAQSPCALCRGDRAGLVRKETPRGWRPRRALRLDALSRGGPSPRVSPWRESPGLKSLSRLGEPLQAERAWSLAKIF